MGSEMCIRDRYCVDAGHHDAPRSIAVEFADQYPFAARQIEAAACLLYTSDAADERSSVDLGGRRILKKKKNSASRGSRMQN